MEDGGGAALVLLDPEEGGELGEAFVEPGLNDVGLDAGEPGVGEGVRDGGSGGGELVKRGYEEGIVFEGVAGIVEDGERLKRLGAEPGLEERGDALGVGGEGGEGGGVGGFDGEKVGAGGGGVDSHPFRRWGRRHGWGTRICGACRGLEGRRSWRRRTRRRLGRRGAAAISGCWTTKRLGWRTPRGWMAKSAVAMPEPVPAGAAGSSG